MRNSHPIFMCFPSVVCVGKETEVTVFPLDISRAFFPDNEYELGIFGLCEDMIDYHQSLEFKEKFRIENGCLKFKFTFTKEQEYSVRFKINGKKPEIVSLYAVEEDLYNLRPLKGELHTHSYYSDGYDGIPMVASNYREEGFDFFALTDHNRMFPSVMLPKLYEGVSLGIEMLRGEEVHTPGSNVHIVHIGGSFSVCEKYIKHREQFEKEVSEIEKTISDVDEQYRFRLASAMWSCREIKKAGGISIFAHPYWKSNLYNVSPEFYNLLFDAKIFDVFELFNGAVVDLDNIQISLWQQQMMKGNVMPVVASSDSHLHDFSNDGFARSFSIVFAESNSSAEIIEAVKAGKSVAAEISRGADDEARFYSTELRYVAFARFLWNNYFNQTWRLCVGEGVLMRRYVCGEDVSLVLSSVSDSVEKFYNKFYGREEVVGIDKKRFEYLAKLKKEQIDSGLTTKGSSLYIYGGNECRL